MKLDSIHTFLSTLLEYRGVRITQTFNSDEGSDRTLVVNCDAKTGRFVIRDLSNSMTWESDSIEETTRLINGYLHPQKDKLNA